MWWTQWGTLRGKLLYCLLLLGGVTWPGIGDVGRTININRSILRFDDTLTFDGFKWSKLRKASSQFTGKNDKLIFC